MIYVSYFICSKAFLTLAVRHQKVPYIYVSFSIQHQDVKQAKINILSKKRLEQAKGKHSISNRYRNFSF